MCAETDTQTASAPSKVQHEQATATVATIVTLSVLGVSAKPLQALLASRTQLQATLHTQRESTRLLLAGCRLLPPVAAVISSLPDCLTHPVCDVDALGLVVGVRRREEFRGEHNVALELYVCGCRVLDQAHKVCGGSNNSNSTQHTTGKVVERGAVRGTRAPRMRSTTHPSTSVKPPQLQSRHAHPDTHTTP